MDKGSILDQEIEVAREVQMSTLPDFMPEMAGYDVAGTVWPADATGGDTFDLAALDDTNMFVLLADATGHGIGPALSALQLQSMLRVALRLGASLDEGFRHINAQMVEDLPEGRFVTACFGLINTQTHVFQFHSAGQGPILHHHTSAGEFEWYEPSCFPLGFIEHQEQYRVRELKLEPGDILALISDGIYEYENEAGELFGTQGVSQVLEANHHLPMSELVAVLHQAAVEYGGDTPQRDDITIVFIQRTEQVLSTRKAEHEFKRSLDSLDDIFNFVAEFFISRGIDSSLRYSVDLAIDELFTNMVRYNADESSDILIELVQEQNGLSVSMTDHENPPFDVTKDGPEVDINLPAEERDTGGLGLHLVKEMVDSFEYQSDGYRCTITFTKQPE